MRRVITPKSHFILVTARCLETQWRYNAGFVPLGRVSSGRVVPGGPLSREWRVMTKIDQELLAIMECPVAHKPLVQVGDWLYCTDGETRRRYPIRDGIPMMLVEESEVVEPDEFQTIMASIGGTDRSA